MDLYNHLGNLSKLTVTNQTPNHLQASFSPTQIFEEGTTEEKGENARLSAFVGAIAVGDLVKSTLGPKGMDKILQSAYASSPTFPCLHGLHA